MSSFAVINPLASATPTGMAVAGDAVAEMLREYAPKNAPPWIAELFRFINDRLRPAPLKMIARLLAVQLVPLVFPRDVFLIFTAHQAPLWRTGRHAVIVHDLISIARPFQHRIQTLYFIAAVPRVLAVAEKVIAISEATKAALLEHIPLPQVQAAAVIPSYSARLESAPDVTPLPRESQRFLFVGAKYRHKNLDLALAAMRRLRSEGNTGARLMVLGCDRSLWAGEIEDAQRGGWIECVPYADDDQLRREYARCTALIYPSFVEGFGLPPLEAMHAGCPVICADIPALRETCGDAAWFVEPRDAAGLARLLERFASGELRDEIAQKQVASTRVLERFSSARIAALWKEFLSECAPA